MQDLGTLGGDGSNAYYINASGAIVGEAQVAGGAWHAFRFTVPHINVKRYRMSSMARGLQAVRLADQAIGNVETS